MFKIDDFVIAINNSFNKDEISLKKEYQILGVYNKNIFGESEIVLKNSKGEIKSYLAKYFRKIENTKNLDILSKKD